MAPFYSGLDPSCGKKTFRAVCLALSSAAPLCAAFFALFAAAPAAVAQVPYRPVRAMGAGMFSDPVSVTTDSSGAVLFADYTGNRITKYRGGAIVAQFGVYGAGPGQLHYPRGIATDSAGNIFVADQGNQRIDKFDANGVFLLSFGSYGAKLGQLRDPVGVAVDSAGDVYVADSTNNRIQIFDNGGAFVTFFGGGGMDGGSFFTPVGVAVDPAGNIFVADANNHRVQKFGSAGQYLAQFGTYGGGAGQFGLLGGIAADASGNVYVADPDNNRIEEFDNNGGFLGGIGAGYNGVAGAVGAAGLAPGQLRGPLGVTVDRQGNVYVSDSGNARGQEFTPAPASVSGILTFDGIAPNAFAQSVTFTFRSTDGSSDIVQTLAISASGAYTLTGLFSKAGVLHIKPAKYLAVNLTLNLSGGNASRQNAIVEPGDGNNDNSVDSSDFALLVGAFNTDSSLPGSGYIAQADFNSDGVVDSTDFSQLVGDFNAQGAL